TPGDQQYQLHKEVADAIQLFYQDLADMSSGAASGSGLENLADKVVVMVWSEFSRRIEQNDNGTDHGSQGPMVVIGGAVHGGAAQSTAGSTDSTRTSPRRRSTTTATPSTNRTAATARAPPTCATSTARSSAAGSASPIRRRSCRSTPCWDSAGRTTGPAPTST